GTCAEIGDLTRRKIRNSHQQVDRRPKPVAGEFEILLRIPDHRSKPFLFRVSFALPLRYHCSSRSGNSSRAGQGRKRTAISKIPAFALSELGHVDILINNAGGSRPLPVDAPDSKWDEAIALNFTSYRRIAHALLPQMIERKWGRIVNITGKSEPEGLNAAFAA